MAHISNEMSILLIRSKKMKILHLLQSSHFSDTENVVCQIIEMMKKDETIDMIYCSSDDCLI